MFELPETITLAGQINDSLTGKIIQKGQLGNSPHKFVWYNRTDAEFSALTEGKTVGAATVKGRWLSVSLDPGYVLLFGECGGKMLYHHPGSKLPKKYHLYITFKDKSFFTMTTRMWGAMELYETGDELEREYVKGMRVTPIESEFTFNYFSELIDSLLPGKKRSVKGLLTQDQIIPGLGNAIAQDIHYRAKLHPKHPIADLNGDQRKALYQAIVETVQEVIEKGGRYDEYDLYNQPGKYIRLMDKKTAGQPCSICGSIIQKIQYLGGARN
jgi:formamidopyrimidine-DNA glycosylase